MLTDNHFHKVGPAFLGLGTHRPDLQAARNYHAMLAAHVIARLCGMVDPLLTTPDALCPKNIAVERAVKRMFTANVLKMFAKLDPREVLEVLAGSRETPEVSTVDSRES